MKKLKIKLSCSIFLICLGIILLEFQNNQYHTNYTTKNHQFKIKLIDYKIDGDQLSIEGKEKEKLMIYYYFQTKKEKDLFIKKIKIGDTLMITGNLNYPSKKQNLYGFDFRKYLLSKNIKWILTADSLALIKHHHSIFYHLKNIVIKRLQKINNKYLDLFIIGKNTLDSDIKNTYSKNGISHLFAISGMHISFLVIFLNKLLKIWIKKKQVIIFILSCFLIFFTFLTNFSPSVLRAAWMYILSQYFPNISSLVLLLIIGTILLLINPYYIYHIGFLFSFIISFCLIYFGKHIKLKEGYFKKLLITSILSFCAGLPILIFEFHEVNFISILWNLIFVPFVSIIIFPLGILTFFCPILIPIFHQLTQILERISLLASNIHFLTFIFRHPPILIIFLYYLIIWLSFRFQKKLLILFACILLIHYHINKLDSHLIISAIYIGQGDCLLIKLPHNQGNLLFDTGGKVEYEKEKWQKKKNETNLATNTIIPYLKAEGIKQIDDLIITHGDYDHLGESIHLIDRFPVKQVFMNSGSINKSEKKLIQKLQDKKISYHQISKYELKIKSNTFYFLNDQDISNENEDSLITYTKLQNKNILLMGDAGEESEKYILKEYNLPKMDILKVGHHGSKNSSKKSFIQNISPKISVISAGINNRFNHPDQEALDQLSAVSSKIYSTNQHGMIKFVIGKKIQIKTSY